MGMEERSGNGGEKWEWRREVEYGFIYMNIVRLLATIMVVYQARPSLTLQKSEKGSSRCYYPSIQPA